MGVGELLEQAELPHALPVHREVVREASANNFPQTSIVILLAALGLLGWSAAPVTAAVLLGHGDASGHDAIREHRIVDLVVAITQLRRAYQEGREGGSNAWTVIIIDTNYAAS